MSPADKPGDDERDPFEDLDQFFAPIEDAVEGDEPAESAPPPPPGPDAEDATEEEAAEALEELEVTIDLPDDSDLLEGFPDDVPEPVTPSEVLGEVDEVEVGASLESTSELKEDGGEWDRLRAEALAGAETEEEPELGGEEAAVSIEDAGEPVALTPDDLSGLEVGAEDQAAAASEFSDVGTSSVLGELPATEAEAAAEHFASGMRESPEELERELLSDLDQDTGSETVRIEPSPPIGEGPTWQEGAQPVVTEEAPAEQAAPVARNVPAALVSGILLGAAVLVLLAINKGAFVVLATAAVLLAQAELYAVMRTRGLQPATLLGLVCGGLTFVGAYLKGEPAILLGVALAMGLTVLWYVAAPVPTRKHTTANAAATLLGVVYVPFMASFAMLLLRFPGEAGRNLFLAMLVITVLYDVSAYAAGTMFGRRPLAPTVSPNKSWEGAIAATFIVLLVSMSIVPVFSPFDADGGIGRAVGLALVIAFLAPLGDLVESAFKRDLGVKDMGSLLPGHGGVLDRIDAILFAAPASYFFLQIVLF